MRRLTIVLMFAMNFTGTAKAQQPVRTCESLASLSLPNTTIEAAATEAASGGGPSFCRVTAVTTHPPAGDRVRIFVGLPLTGWNGRFEGVGGGGFSGGSANGVAAPV